ncbi:protein of unknown function (plasmid) [Cupriavidus taiwanensis]|uniref:Transposase IS204/IS1001/IS1096/IS1165 DDE domain-containing protein n=1 Tax=Cupriavidus taiwanensis TaxID=164546 RepID=A0A375IRU0_9BURK|nr:protein of unknown function [Cupriavidus taiwanensis]
MQACSTAQGILAHSWPLGTNLVEGINNRIKVIKRMAYGVWRMAYGVWRMAYGVWRMAYGFRDDHYFFLKIRAAFPGNRR